MKLKRIIVTGIGLAWGVFAVAPVSAHVVVKPGEVGIAAYQTYTMGVPNEKDIPTVAVRLAIPEGMTGVSPNVKPGWTIHMKKEGEGEDAKVTEIEWTGGSIPQGQRDDFFFSAKAPAAAATLQWKAYQIYRNGTIVSWDQPSTGDMTTEMREAMEKTGKGPYSETKIVDDLAAIIPAPDATGQKETNTVLVYVAIALAAASLGMQLYKKK